jgi:hypothetical protein
MAHTLYQTKQSKEHILPFFHIILTFNASKCHYKIINAPRQEIYQPWSKDNSTSFSFNGGPYFTVWVLLRQQATVQQPTLYVKNQQM